MLSFDAARKARALMCVLVTGKRLWANIFDKINYIYYHSRILGLQRAIECQKGAACFISQYCKTLVMYGLNSFARKFANASNFGLIFCPWYRRSMRRLSPRSRLFRLVSVASISLSRASDCSMVSTSAILRPNWLAVARRVIPLFTIRNTCNFSTHFKFQHLEGISIDELIKMILE